MTSTLRWILLLILLAMTTAAMAVPPDWPYQTGFGDRLLHVHPELNYTQHPDWLDAWERGRLGAGEFLGNFGSTATDELLIDARWTLNPELTHGGLRFRNDIVWQEQRHLPTERLDIWLGLEQHVWRGFGVMAQVTVAEAKETIDLRVGGLWTSADRSRYVQLLYVAEDIVRDEKDDLEPQTERGAHGIDWLLRLVHGQWSFISEGHWSTGFDRKYPNHDASPELLRHEKVANNLDLRARWQPAPRAQLELSWRQAEDEEIRLYRGSATFYDHQYAGWYRVFGARGLLPVADRWRLRGELHRLDRRANADGWSTFVYHRDETLPGIWAEWGFGGTHWLELGYLATFYRWHEDGDVENTGYADKLELAVVLGFMNGAGLKVSLSHEVSLDQFGGASVRMFSPF